MIRTKHLVLALGALALSVSVSGAFFAGGTAYPSVLVATFSLPRDVYEVVSDEYRSRDERRSALIASVREALRTDPIPEPKPVLAPPPQEPEVITISVPSGHGASGYGDASAIITSEEPMPVPVAEIPIPSASSSVVQVVPSATSTQGDDVPASPAGVQ